VCEKLTIIKPSTEGERIKEMDQFIQENEINPEAVAMDNILKFLRIDPSFYDNLL
jgi:hypothetical protein